MIDFSKVLGVFAFGMSRIKAVSFTSLVPTTISDFILDYVNNIPNFGFILTRHTFTVRFSRFETAEHFVCFTPKVEKLFVIGFNPMIHTVSAQCKTVYSTVSTTLYITHT